MSTLGRAMSDLIEGYREMRRLNELVKDMGQEAEVYYEPYIAARNRADAALATLDRELARRKSRWWCFWNCNLSPSGRSIVHRCGR